MMKLLLQKTAIGALFYVTSIWANDALWEQIKKESSRPALLAEWMRKCEGKNESELIKIASDTAAAKETRIGCAVLLLKNHQSPDADSAAMTAFELQVPAGLDEWESANDWRLEYPVAAATIVRPELIEIIVRKGIDGSFNQNLVVTVLLASRKAKQNPEENVKAALKKDLTSDERKRGEFFLSWLVKGKNP